MIRRRLAPSDSAARTCSLSTARAPAMVLMSTAKNAARKVMKTTDSVPMPSHRIESGTHASGGIGRKMLSNPSQQPLHRPIQAHRQSQRYAEGERREVGVEDPLEAGDDVAQQLAVLDQPDEDVDHRHAATAAASDGRAA